MRPSFLREKSKLHSPFLNVLGFLRVNKKQFTTVTNSGLCTSLAHVSLQEQEQNEEKIGNWGQAQPQKEASYP